MAVVEGSGEEGDEEEEEEEEQEEQEGFIVPEIKESLGPALPTTGG